MSHGLVLNVDPDPVSRGRITAALRGAGIQIRESSDAQEAERLAEDLAPALLLVAPMVGEVPGVDVCSRLGAAHSVASILRVPAAQIGRHAADSATTMLPDPVPETLLINTVGLILDLEESRRHAESLRREMESLRQEFHLCLSRTAHDLNESVRGFATFAELLREGGVQRLEPREAAYLNQVQESAERSRELLRYLSSYVQTSREPVESHRNIDFRGVVLAAEAQRREEIERVGATIRVEDLPVVHGNPSRLQQLMGCLLSNSLKYRDKEKPLHIVIQAARDAGDRWVISVADNGMGLEQKHHESIFAPFQRLHGREVPGTGMGLALGRKIVEAHGGTLLVKSAPGQGATFLFSLPAAVS